MLKQEQNEQNKKPGRRSVLLQKGPRLMREKLAGKTFVIPSLITVMGIFCGFLAILSSLKGHYEYAAQCIMIAIIFDGLDGRIARRLNATSAFGREFDSLSDIICFGAAPAILMYAWAFTPNLEDIGLMVCFIYVVCGATRLARFNIEVPGEGKSSFTGLPIPGAAAPIAALINFVPNTGVNPLIGPISAALMLLLALLMVSTVPYFSAKRLKLTRAKLRINVLLLSIVVVLTWRHTRLVLLLISLTYALSGALSWIISHGRRSKQIEAQVTGS